VSFNHDREYTNVLHSPEVEPLIARLLKSKKHRATLDLGYGLGFASLILRCNQREESFRNKAFDLVVLI